MTQNPQVFSTVMISRKSYGFNIFIANHVGEIQTAITSNEWYWLSGKLNIADITTRGCSVPELNEKEEWVYGPKFLELPVNEWPVKQSNEKFDISELKVKP